MKRLMLANDGKVSFTEEEAFSIIRYVMVSGLHTEWI